MSLSNTVVDRDHSDTLARVRDLVPAIEARADDIEAAARVPQDLLEALRRAGAFRMCTPRVFGGDELSAMQAFRVLEAVAAADASVAWHLMVAAGSANLFARLPAGSLETFYARNGPDNWPKHMVAPKGIAVPVEGGYRLSGRWSLASGSHAFEWVGLGFFIKDENDLRRGPSGQPDLRLCLVPREGVKVIETWDAVGLRGTRSDDLEVKDLFIPEGWDGPVMGAVTIPAPTMSVKLPVATAHYHTAIVTGLLRGALADLAETALTRKPASNPTTLMKDDAVFCNRFGEIASKADAVFALAEQTTDMLVACNAAGRDATKEEGAKILAATSLIHHEGTALMDQVIMLSGAQSIYMSNRQQRRWRDLRCVAQHIGATIGHYDMYAEALFERAAATAQSSAR